MIPWQVGWDEERYNQEAAKADSRLLLLDRRKFTRTSTAMALRHVTCLAPTTN
jgi:hypothetical protein